MAHPENQSHIEKLTVQCEEIFAECFRAAERIVLGNVAKRTWESMEAKERYIASIPFVALDFKAAMGNVTNLVLGAAPAQIDQIYDAVENSIVALRRRNDAAEKGDAAE